MSVTRSLSVVVAVVASSLLANQDCQGQNLSCRLKQTHSIQGAVITSITGQFYYSGGGTSVDGPKSVQIRRGEARYNFSRDNSSCVTRLDAIAVIEYQGRSYPGVAEFPAAPDGYCYVTPEVEWVLSSIVSVEAAASATDKSLFKERVRAVTVDPLTGEKTPLQVKFYESVEAFLKASEKGGEDR